MRLTQAVRIGGKLALLSGFVCLNLVFGNSLSYYFGYNATTFGVSQSADPFTAQNVNFTPSAPMVSSSTTNNNSSPWALAGTSSTSVGSGFGSVVSAYGYSVPAVITTQTYTAQSSSSSSAGTFGRWSLGGASTPVAGTNPASNVSGAPAGGGTSFAGWGGLSAASTPSASSSGGASWALSWTPGSGPATYSSTTNSGSGSGWGGTAASAMAFGGYQTGSASSLVWAGVNTSIIPSVTNALTPTPVATQPISPIHLPSLDPPIGGIGAPEPATWFSISAGLAALLGLRLRRRNRA